MNYIGKIHFAHWMVPGEENSKVPGVLHADIDGKWKLILEGAFSNDTLWRTEASGPSMLQNRPPEYFPVLVGITGENKAVTLFECEYEKPELIDFAHWRVTFRPKIIVFGVVFDGLRDFMLTSLSLRYSGLDAWFGKSGISIKSQEGKSIPTIAYEKPEPFDAEVGQGCSLRIGAEAKVNFFDSSNDVRVRQRIWVVTRISTGMHHDELYRIGSRISELAAFALGQPVRLLEANGTCLAKCGELGELNEVPISVIYNVEQIAPLLPDPPPHHILFRLPEVKYRFTDIVKCWLDDNMVLEPLTALYLGVLRRSPTYVEHRFLSFFQGLESYDRRNRPPTQKEAEEHQHRVNRILQCVTVKKDRDWLENRIKRRGESNAISRLSHVVQDLDASWLLSEEEMAKAVDLRDFLTHYDVGNPEATQETRTSTSVRHNLGAKLQTLMELVVMRSLGFTTVETNDRVKRSGRLDRRLV